MMALSLDAPQSYAERDKLQAKARRAALDVQSVVLPKYVKKLSKNPLSASHDKAEDEEMFYGLVLWT